MRFNTSTLKYKTAWTLIYSHRYGWGWINVRVKKACKRWPWTKIMNIHQSLDLWTAKLTRKPPIMMPRTIFTKKILKQVTSNIRGLFRDAAVLVMYITTQIPRECILSRSRTTHTTPIIRRAFSHSHVRHLRSIRLLTLLPCRLLSATRTFPWLLAPRHISERHTTNPPSQYLTTPMLIIKYIISLISTDC